MSFYGLMMKAMARMGTGAIRSLEKMTLDPRAVQEQLLLAHLKENQDTDFGRENGFAEIHSIEDYQKRVPVREYDEFAPYIERMVKGEDNVLITEHIAHYNKTSGTLGCSKYIPLAKKQVSICGKYFALYTNAMVSTKIGYGWNDGKGINLQEGNSDVLPTGSTYGCASSIATKDGPFKNMYSEIYTSPVEARQPAKGVVTRYIHARFALTEPNATYVVSTFASIMLEMFRYVEDNHEMLVRDIEQGTIDKSVNLPDEVRASLLTQIRPDPKRAEELRKAFAEGFDTPWALRVWPKLEYAISVFGANFSSYTEKLKNCILGDSVRLFYFGVAASEGIFSVVSGMDTEDTIMAPDGCCLTEFRDADDESATCLTMDQLEVGKRYELIITNYSGLYRYRMHDVICVTGYHNKTPLIRFENRAGFAVNIRGEKTSESAIRSMIKETEKELGLDVTDYSVYADTDATPPGYVMLMELRHRPEGVSDGEIRRCLKEKLMLANEDIVGDFEDGYLDEPKLVLLQPETYLLYRDVMIHRGSAAGQLKPVHVIRNEFQRKFFFALHE